MDNEIVGFGKMYLDSGVVESMFVHPDRMFLGIGTKIMEHLEKIAIEFGLTELTLDSSLNAVRFYRRCGFKGDQIGKHYSSTGNGLDCVRMSKEIR